MWLGREPKKGILTDHKKMYQDCLDLFARMGMHIDPHEKMKNLTVAKMQMVEIIKAVSYNSSIVIMDEPTSSLTEAEVEDLFKIIEDLKSKGRSHHLYLPQGWMRSSGSAMISPSTGTASTSAQTRAANLTQDKVIKMMVGREITNMFPKVECPIGDVVLKVEDLCSGPPGTPCVF